MTNPTLNSMTNGNLRHLQDVINDLKDEAKDFLNTRLAMLMAEMRQKMQTIKMAAPLLVIGLLMLVTAWFVFTGFLIAIIAQAFLPSAWAYVLSFIIVAVLYAIIGGGAAAMAYIQHHHRLLAYHKALRGGYLCSAVLQHPHQAVA